MASVSAFVSRSPGTTAMAPGGFARSTTSSSASAGFSSSTPADAGSTGVAASAKGWSCATASATSSAWGMGASCTSSFGGSSYAARGDRLPVLL
eukprot:13776925-Alexandrium_andersonii.AAC.1